MKSSFFSGLLFFFLLTVITNGQNLLPERTIENFKKSKGLMINPEEDMLMHEKSMSRDLSWQVSAGQRQDPTINPCANNRKKKDISKLNGSMYRPGTIVVDDKYRYSYTYDENGNELTSLYETFTNNIWVNDSKYNSIYDQNGNQLSNLKEIWKNNAWKNGARYTFTYDNNGNRLSKFFELWADTVWGNCDRYTYTYDNKGNILTSLYEQWEYNTWMKKSRDTYSYDDNGNTIAVTFETCWSEHWSNSYRNSYTYDASGNLVESLSETWGEYSWRNRYKDTYAFDKNRNELTFRYEIWLNDTWVFLERGTLTYDNNGNFLIWQSELWKNNLWVDNARASYSYNDDGNLVIFLFEKWTNNTWVNSYNNIYTYDTNKNAIKGEYHSWNDKDSSWVKGYGYLTLYYNNRTDFLQYRAGNVDATYTLTTTDNKDNELSVNTYSIAQNYPNPFNPSTVIQYSLPYESNVSVTVYNTLGQVVKTFNEGTKQTGSYNVNFNGEGLSSGIYLYNINAVSIDGKQNFQATKKMILIK